MNAGQHTVKYKKEGDYGKSRPQVSPVEYQQSKIFPGTCEKCVYNVGQHSSDCVIKRAV